MLLSKLPQSVRHKKFSLISGIYLSHLRSNMATSSSNAETSDHDSSGTNGALADSESGATISVYPSDQEAFNFIKQHEVSTTTKFVAMKSTKRVNLNDIDSLSGRKIWWNDTTETVTLIPFDGIPFVVLGTEVRECQHGPNRHKMKKIRVPGLGDYEEKFTKRRASLNTTKKFNCPARIYMKKILKFPQFKLHGKNTRFRKSMLAKTLRSTYSIHTQREYRVYVSIPNITEHQDHPIGEWAGKSIPMDKEIRTEIQKLAAEGVTDLKEMKQHLEVFVKDQIAPEFDADIPLNSRRFNPTNKDIKNQMYKVVSGPSELQAIVDHITKTPKKKIIIDTDGSFDDAQAILMALNAADVDVVAITTVQGNTDALEVGRNILRLLKLVGRIDIPVFVGCDHTILGKQIRPPGVQFPGIDCEGGVPDLDPIERTLIQMEPATQALVRLTKEHKGQITLVPVGPLTNIAVALKLDSEFGSRLKECFFMGGNYYGKGNTTMSAEYNFHCDPEAAYIVLEQLQCPTTLIGWEACSDFLLPWAWNEELASGKYKVLDFLSKLIHIEEHHAQGNTDIYIEIADQFAMGAALEQSVIRESQKVYATVELKGEITRGQMVIDWNNISKKDPNVTIIVKPDKELVQQMLSSAILK